MINEGPSDTVLTSHGSACRPGRSPGLGWRPRQHRQPRILRQLQPGEYWLSVRHKDGNATGAYPVGVTTRG